MHYSLMGKMRLLYILSDLRQVGLLDILKVRGSKLMD